MSLESIKARNLRAFTSTYRSRAVSILILPTVLSLTGIKCPSIERAAYSSYPPICQRRYLRRRHIPCQRRRPWDLFDLSELTSVIFRPVAKALLKTESRNQSALALESFAKGTHVQRRLLTTVDRRDLLRFAMGGVGAAAVSTVIREPATARAVDLSEKRKARYQANSAEVQNVYRVNSYPTR